MKSLKPSSRPSFGSATNQTLPVRDDVLLGGGGDGGIDALAILADGRLPVSTEEDLQFFFDSHGRLEVEFVFIQAKSSSAFSSSDIGNFLFGVEQLNHALQSTSNLLFKVKQFKRLISLVGQSIKMQNLPKCSLYFATTGKWMGETDPKGRIAAGQKHLGDRNIFSEVLVTPIDAVLKSSARTRTRVVKASRAPPHSQGLTGSGSIYRFVAWRRIYQIGFNDDGDLNRELFLQRSATSKATFPSRTHIG